MPTTVVHKIKSEYNVYIGRPSLWGNPFKIGDWTEDDVEIVDRETAIAEFEKLMWSRLNGPRLEFWSRELLKLRGKRLGCWCKPLPCHGDVLVKLIETIWGDE